MAIFGVNKFSILHNRIAVGERAKWKSYDVMEIVRCSEITVLRSFLWCALQFVSLKQRISCYPMFEYLYCHRYLMVEYLCLHCYLAYEYLNSYLIPARYSNVYLHYYRKYSNTMYPIPYNKSLTIPNVETSNRTPWIHRTSTKNVSSIKFPTPKEFEIHQMQTEDA